MKIKLKTDTDVVYHIEAAARHCACLSSAWQTSPPSAADSLPPLLQHMFPNPTCVPTSSETVQDVKAALEQQDSHLKADTHQIIYQGRILEDGASLGNLGVSDGHVLLVVPRPSRSAVSSGRSTASGRGLLSGPLSSQHNLQRRQYVYDPEEAALLVQFAESLQELEGFGDQRQGDTMDLVLGITIGFLLGCIAGLCLVEPGMSSRLRLGVFVGIGLNVCFTVARLLAVTTMAPTPTQAGWTSPQTTTVSCNDTSLADALQPAYPAPMTLPGFYPK
eukprot:CAMPEP_0117694332 /NCGR_PEP_ID=MMETSP0804-20121206/27389_1 /TAXON_ID=1074897 /ORGANISM="Tetraselmis astigmatica, Strain CCMP880" /LENGTH=275 /DNA_ID=CAMNT_0005508009 /DNA_START=205 /DNA_END=1032 /DNA_ORIENTATION=+